MSDPTAKLRGTVLDTIIPKNSPLGQSRQASKLAAEEQLASDEANNYVMKREPVVLPPEAEAVVNPEIPITQTTQSAPVTEQVRSPAEVIQPQETVAVSDGSDKLLGQLDKSQAESEARYKKQEEERASKITDYQNKLDAIEKKGPFKFDDRSIWAKQSTGGKIALLIGGFLSSASPGSADAFRKGIESEVQRDLAVQNKMMENGKEEKNNLLTQLTRELGNKEAAGAAWESRVYKGIADKLAYQRDIAKSAIQQGNADRAYKLAISEYELKRNIALSKASTDNIPGYSGRITDATERRKFTDALQASQSIKQQLHDLREITKKTGKSFSPETRAKAQFAIGAIMSDLKAFKQLGTLDRGVETLVNKLVQNPTDLFSLDSSSLAKLNQFEKYIDGGLQRAASANKLTPTGIDSYVTRK